MTARPRRDRDQPVGTLFDGLAGKAIVDHIVEHDPAPAVRGLVNILARAERGDQHRHLPLLAQRHVLIEAVVGLVDDLVDRERRGGPIGVGAVVLGQFLGEAVEPFVELTDRARVERRKRADDPRLALGDDQLDPRDDEQRRADDRQAQAVERGGKGHVRLRINRAVNAA